MVKGFFNATICGIVDIAICDVFKVEKSKLHEFRDTDEKKMAVYVLFDVFQFDWHVIAREYKMTYLYVSTVAEEIKYKLKNDAWMKQKVSEVMARIDSVALELAS